LIVLSDRSPSRLSAGADLLRSSLGLDQARIVAEAELDPADVPASDLIFMGVPRKADLLSGMAGHAAVDGPSFAVDGQSYGSGENSLFVVFAHPETPGRAAALFLPPGAGDLEAVARKIPHYGRFSYLVFRKAQNIAKGVWPVTDSPLIHRFAEADVPSR
jgi:hypothetical protein